MSLGIAGYEHAAPMVQNSGVFLTFLPKELNVRLSGLDVVN